MFGDDFRKYKRGSGKVKRGTGKTNKECISE